MKRYLGFAAVAAGLTFGAAWGITLLNHDAQLARALWSSAAIAFVVQVLAFVIARPFMATNPIAGWGLGSLLRFVALVAHALGGVRFLGLESTPALISLAAFLFVTMLVEPIFLKQS